MNGRYMLLRKVMTWTGHSADDLAFRIGRSKSYLDTRMAGRHEFTISDAKKIMDYLGIHPSWMSTIFLEEKELPEGYWSMTKLRGIEED